MSESVLIVEDDELQRDMLSMLLSRKLGLGAVIAKNGRDALDIMETNPAHSIKLVVLDLDMPVMGGMEALEIMQQRYPYLPVIMLTGSKDIDHAVKAMKMGALDFITKPYETQRIIVTVKNALKISTLSKELTRLKTQENGHFKFENLCGFEDGLLRSVTLGRKAAASDITVLLTGETGTGKEVFAKAIHGSSKRAGEAFVAVNCGALPSQLVESILFGHEKGAFTGANQKTIGKFREANRGTIFLDEVAELSLDTQVKLLRVLQQKEVEPIGSEKTIPVNIRIISATNKCLAEEVKEGRFREDLFFRLNVLQIELPPLRERKQDIPHLVTHFIDRFVVAGDSIPKTVSHDALDFLTYQDWPGNVRQLENTIKRALVLSDSNTILLDDFQYVETSPPSLKTQTQQEKTSDFISLLDLAGDLRTLSDLEKEIIRFAYTYCNQNVTKTAKKLGLAKSTLYKKLQSLKKPRV